MAPDITLQALHQVFQAAMGWDDAHLYAFAQPLRATESFWAVPSQRKWQEPNPDNWCEPMGNDAKLKNPPENRPDSGWRGLTPEQL